MTLFPASSTPRPLPRKRESADKRPRLALAGAVPAQPSDDNVNSSGLAPAIQSNEAPRARRKPVQTNEVRSSRPDHLARIEVLRIEIHSLVEAIALELGDEQLDLIRDETGSYSRYRAVLEAITWTDQAHVTLETGLMQLARALQPIPTKDHHG